MAETWWGDCRERDLKTGGSMPCVEALKQEGLEQSFLSSEVMIKKQQRTVAGSIIIG
jgi:hypothetical protein